MIITTKGIVKTVLEREHINLDRILTARDIARRANWETVNDDLDFKVVTEEMVKNAIPHVREMLKAEGESLVASRQEPTPIYETNDDGDKVLAVVQPRPTIIIGWKVAGEGDEHLIETELGVRAKQRDGLNGGMNAIEGNAAAKGLDVKKESYTTLELS